MELCLVLPLALGTTAFRAPTPQIMPKAEIVPAVQRSTGRVRDLTRVSELSAARTLAATAAAVSLQHPLAAAAIEQPAAYASPTSLNMASLLLDLGILQLREPVDVYYFFIAVGLTIYGGKKLVTGTIDEAKSYDDRGAMANAMIKEKKKRERAEALDRTKRNDPAYERLQAEARERADRRAKWKVHKLSKHRTTHATPHRGGCSFELSGAALTFRGSGCARCSTSKFPSGCRAPSSRSRPAMRGRTWQW
jgi:hypothetical protein